MEKTTTTKQGAEGIVPAWEPAPQGFAELRAALAEGRPAKIAGEVVSLREQSKLTFVALRSGGDLVQAVGFGPVAKGMATLAEGSWAELKGAAKADARAKGGFELSVAEIVESSISAPRPVLEGSADELWLSHPALRLRRPEVALALRLRAALLSECRRWLESKGFCEVCTPKLIGAPSESGSEVFEVKYFETKAYLAQSPQFANNPVYTQFVLH